MAGPRKSTAASRARSSSVTSNASATDSTSAAATKAKTATPKSPRSPKAAKESKEPKSPKPKTPKASKASKEPKVLAEASTPAAAAAVPASPKAATATPKASKSPSKKAAAAATPSTAETSTVVDTPKKAPATPRKSKTSTPRKKTEEFLTPAQQAAIASRPPLPNERNPCLKDIDVPVKLQIIKREDAEIIIGRVKLAIPPKKDSDHAFLLKRFDTEAMAASSMFRMAFPAASAEEELVEMDYLKKRYQADAANGGLLKVYKRPRGRPSKKALEEMPFDAVQPKGSTGVKLQGTWIFSADALELAKEYGLERWARPLIEARASTKEGVPILIPSANDKVSTPTSVRSKKMLEKSLQESEGSPSSAIARAAKRVKEDGLQQEIHVQKTAMQTGMTADEVARQIAESQALAKGIQAKSTPTSTPSRKRRAAHQAPSAHNDALADGEDYESGSNAVVRSLRRTQRIARRRPVATTAGALGAVGAVGAGALAYVAGGNLDVAMQMVQQGVSNLSSWFF